MTVHGSRLNPAQRLFLELLDTPTTSIKEQATKVQAKSIDSLDSHDWQYLWLLIQRSGLPGYCLAILTEASRLHGIRIPTPLTRRLTQARTAALYSYLLHRKVYDDLAAALEHSSIPHIPLKGIVLIGRLYPDPGWRTLGDIDILVRDKDLQSTHATLLSLGFTPQDDATRERMELFHYHYDYFRTIGASTVHIEVHWKLDNALPLDTFQPMDSASSTRHLDTTDEILYLLLHSASHYTRTIPKWQVDIHFLATSHGLSLDSIWPELESRASAINRITSLRFARMMYDFLLSLAHHPAPPDFILDPHSFLQSKWLYYIFTVLLQDSPRLSADKAMCGIRYKMHMWRSM